MKAAGVIVGLATLGGVFYLITRPAVQEPRPEPPPVPEPEPEPKTGGKILIGYVWWEGLPEFLQILAENEWPANTDIVTTWKIQNTGEIETDFSLDFMGHTSFITLTPGSSGVIGPDSVVTTGDPGGYKPAVNLYANDKLVDTGVIEIKTVALLPPDPGLEIVSWSWLPHDPPFTTEEVIGMWMALRSLSAASFGFHTSVVCQRGAFSSSGPDGFLQPGETKEFSRSWTNVWWSTSDTVILEIKDSDENVLGEIQAEFSVR